MFPCSIGSDIAKLTKTHASDPSNMVDPQCTCKKTLINIYSRCTWKTKMQRKMVWLYVNVVRWLKMRSMIVFRANDLKTLKLIRGKKLRQFGRIFHIFQFLTPFRERNVGDHYHA